MRSNHLQHPKTCSQAANSPTSPIFRCKYPKNYDFWPFATAKCPTIQILELRIFSQKLCAKPPSLNFSTGTSAKNHYSLHFSPVFTGFCEKKLSVSCSCSIWCQLFIAAGAWCLLLPRGCCCEHPVILISRGYLVSAVNSWRVPGNRKADFLCAESFPFCALLQPIPSFPTHGAKVLIPF